MRRLTCLFPLLLLMIWAAPAAAQTEGFLPGHFYDDRHGGMIYGGTWVQADGAGYFMNNRTYTDTLNSTVQFTVVGDTFTWYVIFFDTVATVQVCVDASCRTQALDNNASSVIEGVTESGFGEGPHAVVLTKLQNGQRFSFMGVFVHEPLPSVSVTNFPSIQVVSVTSMPSMPVVVATPAYISQWELEDSEENTQQVAFSYSLTAGDLLSSMVGLAILFIALIAFMFWLYTRGSEPNG